MKTAPKDSFVSLLVLNGEISVKSQDGEIKASKGGSVFIPCGVKAEIKGKAELLYSYI